MRRPQLGQWAFVLCAAAALCLMTEAEGRILTNHSLIGDFAHNITLTCRDVYNFTDQCAFVQQHCDDEITGFIDYFRLYFCGPSKVIAIIAMVSDEISIWF